LNAVRPNTVSVPIMSLSLGESPRLSGEDKAHIKRLAEIEHRLPPILVHRSTMKVIDGFHRLMAASLRGQEEIDVEFFEGSVADAFLRGVEANIAHGLPLSQADRHAAAARILVSHPAMSDRAIAKSTGLGARTVAELRRIHNVGEQPTARVGADGRVRPLNSSQGRLRVARLITENPGVSLRKAAQDAGVSPATALDVRRRLDRGDEIVPAVQVRRQTVIFDLDEPEPAELEAAEDVDDADPTGALLCKLMRDPSLRQNEQGRQLLRMMRDNVAGASNLSRVRTSVPPHWLNVTTQLALQISQMWSQFAVELDKRGKIADPMARGPLPRDLRRRGTT
jgi:ParB-like chromosome segregation protein Spo0J